MFFCFFSTQLLFKNDYVAGLLFKNEYKTADERSRVCNYLKGNAQRMVPVSS